MGDSRGVRGDPALREKIAAIFAGSLITQLAYVAAKLGIPDLLAAGPLESAEVAARTNTNSRALDLMMRTLAALEVFERRPDGRYRLAPIGAYLRSSPGFRSQALLLGEEYFAATGALLHTAQSGAPSFDRVHGAPFYAYLHEHRDTASRFNEVMLMSAPVRYADVPAKFDFTRARRLIDVGGGLGGLTTLILRAAPNLRATLFDSPGVIADARAHIAATGLDARCDLVAGDFFESIPRGGDVYLLSSVIPNWDDARAAAILRNCRAAIAPEADLVLIEYVFTDRRPYSAATLLAAVAALAIQGSVIRDEAEYRAMLRGAGFRVCHISPLNYEPFVVIHARPLAAGAA